MAVPNTRPPRHDTALHGLLPGGQGQVRARNPRPTGSRAPVAAVSDHPQHRPHVLYHWHGGTITRRAKGLLARAPYLEVAINPEDAKAAGLSDGDDVRVISRRGELDGRAIVTETVHPGEIFVPFVKLQESAANFLTNAVFDPQSKIPEYKVCAVRIENPAAPARWRRGRRHMGLPVGRRQ